MMDGAISIGTPLPDVDVEIVPNDPEERGAPKRVNIKDACDGKAVLWECQALSHPPAMIATFQVVTSSDKLKNLGVSKVAVVTMNDSFECKGKPIWKSALVPVVHHRSCVRSARRPRRKFG